MYQSDQTPNRNHLIRKPCYHLSLAPWAAAIGLAVAMFLNPSGAFALITDFPSWEVASEFNDSVNPDFANPSGVWSYGSKPTLQGAFSLGTAYNPSADISGWGSLSQPTVSHSIRTVPFVTTINPIIVPPRVLLLHPGPSGEYAVLRFTAPLTGTYRVSGQFWAVDDYGGTTTDVWILKNNSLTGAFSGSLDYNFGARFVSFTTLTYKLKVGQYLDFEVGYGSNGNYNYDSTGLNAVIEKIR